MYSVNQNVLDKSKLFFLVLATFYHVKQHIYDKMWSSHGVQIRCSLCTTCSLLVLFMVTE